MAELNKESVQVRFRTDIEALAEGLVATFGLKYSKAEKHLSWALGRWMDFRLRYVDPHSRTVLFSDRFAKQIPMHVRRMVGEMAGRFQKGENVNPYQGKGLILHNDYSGRRHDQRTDLLWADWKILHFHLTDKPAKQGEFFTPRSGYHLLALVEHDVVLFIDALPHLKGAQYADVELLRTVKRCWPEYLERYEVKGILPDKNWTGAEHYELRRNGVGAFVHIDGKVYMGPGMGVTSAVTSLNVGVNADRVLDAIDELADVVCDPTEQFQRGVSAHGVVMPEFSLIFCPRGLAVYESQSNHAFALPRGQSSWLSYLHDSFYPQWAADAVAQQEVALAGVAGGK